MNGDVCALLRIVIDDEALREIGDVVTWKIKSIFLFCRHDIMINAIRHAGHFNGLYFACIAQSNEMSNCDIINLSCAS